MNKEPVPMNVVIDIGLLYEAIQKKGWRGISQAAANCRVHEASFHKLERGEIPRLDALFRICSGLGISPKDLIQASTLQETKDRGGCGKTVAT